MSGRGVYEHRERARQLIDFRDMCFGSITPMDVDGLIEYRGKAFVYFEYKLDDTKMKDGQRLALERSVASHRSAGKQAIAIVCEHDTWECDEDVPAAACRVREYYANPAKGWVRPGAPETAYGLTKRFLDWVDDENRLEL